MLVWVKESYLNENGKYLCKYHQKKPVRIFEFGEDGSLGAAKTLTYSQC